MQLKFNNLLPDQIVIKRRVEAYELLETLINSLMLTVYDSDHKLYHYIFSTEGGWAEIYRIFIDSTCQPLWLGDDLFAKTRELNIMFLQASHEKRDPVEFGKTNYVLIAELRQQIENLLAKDMAYLHDVKGFLKRRNDLQSVFSPIDLRG